MLKLRRAFFGAIILLLTANVASACSCGMLSVAEARDRAVIVFAGKYIGTGPQGHKFKVERVWKGVPPAEVEVLVRHAGTSCDPGLKKGRRMLVYAYPGRGRFPLFASYCGRTRVLNVASEDIKQLEEIEPGRSAHAIQACDHRVAMFGNRAQPNNGMHPTANSVALIRKTPWLIR